MLFFRNIGAGRQFGNLTTRAVTRRSDSKIWQNPKKKRRWITNSAGVNLLELAPVALQSVATGGPKSAPQG